MSVIKVRIQKDFTVIYNGVLELPNLSFKAKGLWAYCMSKPDNWQFHVSHLATVCKDKERSIYSALDELIAAGLVIRSQEIKKKGERKGREGFCQVEYAIYPYPQEIQEIFAQRRFADAQVATAQNPSLVSTDKRVSTDKEKNPPPPSSKSKDPWLKIRSEFEEEDFSFIKKRHSERPANAEPIKNLKAWAIAVLESRLDFVSENESIAKKHEKQAKEFEKTGQKHRGDRVTCSKGYVEFTDGPHHKIVNYAVTDEEWELQTGWRSNEKKY